MSQEAVHIDIDSEIGKLISQLHSLPDQLAAPKTMRNALNSAARKVRKQMLADVKNEYAVTKKSVLRDKAQGSPQVLTASSSDLSAAIRARGHMQEIMTFKTRPNAGKAPAAGQVLASGSLKGLEKDGLKAFLVTFANGHRAIVERKGAGRGSLRKLLSPSVSHMLWNPSVLGPAENQTYQFLQAEIRKRVEQLNLR